MAETKDNRMREHFQRLIDEGLGGTRYKEHEVAPYGLIVKASMQPDLWSGVFYSWLSIKGHLQGMHGFDRTQMFAARDGDTVTATFITVWDRAETLYQWLEGGYPVPEMLEAMGVPEEMIELELVRDYS
ncbi:MAG TPA: hypothetical protein VIL51_00020 [Thermoleophilia bacterium]